MVKKFGFLLGAGVGYVLGARAGRQRYDQIATKVRGAWRSPSVQTKAEQAQHLAKEKAGHAGQAVMEKAGQGVHVAKEKFTGGDDSASRSTSTVSGAGAPGQRFPADGGTTSGPTGTPPSLPSTPSDKLPPHSDGTGGTNS